MILRLAMGLVGVCALMGVAPTVDGDREVIPTAAVPELNKMQLVEVVRIVDGDTIVLDIQGKETLFELLAVNSPEFIERDPTPRKYSRQAWFALNTLLDGESVYIHMDPAYRKNAAGRMTGYLFRAPDLLFVNQEIVRQGYAKHKSSHSTVFAESLAWWQQHAKDANKGIWNIDEAVIVDPEPVPTPAKAPEPTPAPADVVIPATLVPATPAGSESDRPDQFVFLTKSGSKYHTKDCRYHSPSSRRIHRDDARKEHGACKVCKPDEPREHDASPAQDD
ncbi:MAG: thermonuclease family protein [Phycisphaerales bacterium]|nr:thermonuclease family protein [Phycisphaerales bacterium]